MHVEVSIIFPMLAATYSVPDFIRLLKQNLASHITSQQKASSESLFRPKGRNKRLADKAYENGILAETGV